MHSSEPSIGKYHYPEYSEFDQRRIEANNAIVGLLAGSRLATNALQLSQGSQVPLSEMFPAVTHVERFNLVVEDARNILLDAERHLANLAIPYAQSLQEDHLQRTIKVLQDHGLDLSHPEGAPTNRLNASNLHEIFFHTCDVHVGRATSDVDSRSSMLEIFHLLRRIRNANTHSGGRVSSSIQNDMDSLSEDALSHWKKINQGKTPQDIQGNDGKISLTAEHIFTEFSVIKQLGRLAQRSFIEVMPEEYFAKVSIEHLVRSTSKQKNSDGWKRSLERLTKRLFPKGLNQLETVAREEGHWTRAQW